MLSPSSQEFERIALLAEKTSPNECIISIEKITNVGLEERYKARKEKLGTKVVECEVFHGARNATSAIPAILTNGYCAARNTTAAYGIGTYLAEAYSYSKHYSGKAGQYKSMLVNQMCYTSLTLGCGNKVMHPDLVEAGAIWTDNIKNPTIYSVPHDHQILPTYLVQFY